MFSESTMRRKRIKQYADVACRMFMGWPMGDELETLSTFPDWRLHINILEGTALHSEVGSLNLRVAKEIQAWPSNECEKDGIDYQDLKTADLFVDIDTFIVATNKIRIVCFSFDSSSILATDEAKYTAQVAETYWWHKRKNI